MGKGKGVPDHFDVDATVDVGATVATDMVAQMSMDTDLTVDSTMRFPDAIRTEMAVTQPIRTEMDMAQRIAITEPIRTEMQMDLKPVVVDLCLNLGINKLPRNCIRRPYHHRLAVSVMGTEVAAVSFAGSQDIIIDDLARKPAVAWGGEEPAPGTARAPAPPTGGHAHGAPPPDRGGGLRIDLGP